MVIFLAAGALAGIFLGFRFNVFILAPAILLAIITIALSHIVSRHGIGLIVITASATVVLLQIGYLGGRVLNVVIKSQLSERWAFIKALAPRI